MRYKRIKQIKCPQAKWFSFAFKGFIESIVVLPLKRSRYVVNVFFLFQLFYIILSIYISVGTAKAFKGCISVSIFILITPFNDISSLYQSVNNHSVSGAWSQVTTKIDAAVQKNMAVRVALVSTSFFAAIQMIARQGKIGLRQVLRSPSQPSLPRR